MFLHRDDVPPKLTWITSTFRQTLLVLAQSFGRSIRMLDVIMLALGLGFFAAAVAYCYACDRF